MESEERQHHAEEAGATNLGVHCSSSSRSIMRPHQQPHKKTASTITTATLGISNNNSSRQSSGNPVKGFPPLPPASKTCCRGTAGNHTTWMDIYYIATWGILGAVLRVYLNRLLGLDCDSETSGDFWQASRICLTATGETSRKGGALFVDLPANVVGSFLMGLLSASTSHPIPWFPARHHLQRHTSWHTGLTTGFCGCFTTCKFVFSLFAPIIELWLTNRFSHTCTVFNTVASWNTQMVIMLDGSQTENGPQVASALFGYAIGIMTAIAAFLWGRVVAQMWRNSTDSKQQSASDYRTPTFDEDDEEQPNSQHGGRSPPRSERRSKVMVLGDAEAASAPEPVVAYPPETTSPPVEQHSDVTGVHGDAAHRSEDINDDDTTVPEMHMGGSILLFSTLLIVIGLILGFGYGDYVFYRRMWMTCFCTPFGAILRHELKYWLPASTKSIQWGTWTANVVGAMVSIFLQAVMVRYLAADQAETYLGCFLWALKVGFAGSLSTVSTLVKELVSLERLVDRHVYGIVTLLISMGVGLAIYSPIVRS